VALVIVPFWGALYPVVDSIALSGQRRFGMDYARMRLWGSMSFLLASLLTGMATGAFGIGIVPYLMTAMFALAFASAWLLPRLGPVRAPHLRAMLPLDGTASGLRPILPLFIGSALIIGSHGFFYAFGSIHYASIGHSQTQIGLLWAFGVICEVALFWYARAFMHRAKPETFIIIGGLGAVARWMLLPVSAASPAPLLTDFMLQSLHALSFALVYIATQKAVSERFADAGTGAVLGLNIFCNGVVFAVTTFVGGYLYEHFAIWGVYAMAACALTGIGVVAIVAKRQPRAVPPKM
jgi:PPP family 3-phenylpropionic acid transporter